MSNIFSTDSERAAQLASECVDFLINDLGFDHEEAVPALLAAAISIAKDDLGADLSEVEGLLSDLWENDDALELIERSFH